MDKEKQNKEKKGGRFTYDSNLGLKVISKGEDDKKVKTKKDEK